MSIPDTTSIQGFTEHGFLANIDGEIVEVRYDDITSIRIETTNQGPFLPDCFWIVETERVTITLENDDPSFTMLLPKLQDLPGFNNKAVILAMGSVDHAGFLVWEKD
ncbi:hypothetical protein GF325_18980 [Candidatus Bathyarchaeota archaeon]|nr:hypothetical protein [Candidatus Bathyarchaeota archaeon]